MIRHWEKINKTWGIWLWILIINLIGLRTKLLGGSRTMEGGAWLEEGGHWVGLGALKGMVLAMATSCYSFLFSVFHEVSSLLWFMHSCDVQSCLWLKGREPRDHSLKSLNLWVKSKHSGFRLFTSGIVSQWLKFD
jgi:hypothetical protein